MPVEQLLDPLPVGRGEPRPRLGRAQEQVDGDDEREQAERAGQQVVEVAAGVRRPLDRAVHADQLVDDVLEPLEERVVTVQRADREVAEADRDVRHDQDHEHVQHAPPGARVTDRVELAVEVEQPGQQHDRHDGGDGDRDLARQVREVQEVDDDVEGEQRQDGLPGPALAPPQPEREQYEQQADDDVGGAGDVGQGAGHERLELVQLVDDFRLEDREDVGQADEEDEQRRDRREPRQPLAPLSPRWARRGRVGPPVAMIGRVTLAHLRSLVRPRTTVKHRSHGLPAMRRIRGLLKIVVTIAATFSTSGGPHRHRVLPMRHATSND